MLDALSDNRKGRAPPGVVLASKKSGLGGPRLAPMFAAFIFSPMTQASFRSLFSVRMVSILASIERTRLQGLAGRLEAAI